MTISQYRKEINPVFDKSSRRPKLTGYRAQLFDGDLVIYDRDHYNYHEAENALDERVYDLLNDQPSIDDNNVCEVCFGEGNCPRCNQPTAAPICATCSGEGDCPDCSPIVDLTTDLYNVVCLTLSGAAATTAISELRRVQKRYEQERSK